MATSSIRPQATQATQALESWLPSAGAAVPCMAGGMGPAAELRAGSELAMAWARGPGARKAQSKLRSLWEGGRCASRGKEVNV